MHQCILVKVCKGFGVFWGEVFYFCLFMFVCFFVKKTTDKPILFIKKPDHSSVNYYINRDGHHSISICHFFRLTLILFFQNRILPIFINIPFILLFFQMSITTTTSVLNSYFVHHITYEDSMMIDYDVMSARTMM